MPFRFRKENICAQISFREICFEFNFEWFRTDKPQSHEVRIVVDHHDDDGGEGDNDDIDGNDDVALAIKYSG